MMPKAQYVCHFILAAVITVITIWLGINSRKTDSEWPLPDNVVLHHTMPFNADNALYKLFAKNENDFLKMVYDKTADGESGMRRALTEMEMLMFSAGCLPGALFKTYTHTVYSGPGNTGTLNDASLVDATTLVLKKAIANLKTGDNLVYYLNNDSIQETMTVTAIADSGSVKNARLTVERMATSANAASGLTKGTNANALAAGTIVYRAAAATAVQQPYHIEDLSSNIKTTVTTAINNADFEDHTICHCFNSVRKIVDKYEDASTKASIEAKYNALDDPIKSRFKSDLEDTNSKSFKWRAVDSCISNYIPEYTSKYAGVIDARSYGRTAQCLLLCGILTIMAGSMYHFADGRFKFTDDFFSDSAEGDQVENKYVRGWCAILTACTVILSTAAAILNFTDDDHFETCSRTDASCNLDLNYRPSTYDTPNRPVNLAQKLFTTIALAIVFTLSLIRFRYQFTDNFPSDTWARFFENKVMRRIAVDVPFITGYACMGLSLLAQAGVQDVTSLMFSFALMFVTGFIQHMSNVTKLLYDGLCRNTDTVVMKKLFDNDEDKRYYVKPTLQFFGWSRLFAFFTVLLTTVAFLTMTRETTESNLVQSYMNGQLFYFALAFFWSNIGYDMLRELVPFTFEKMHMDMSKLVITLIYLLYFNVNLYFLNAAAADSEGTVTLHSGHIM